ncbi:Crp/Fnr family transcriptional regulator [Flavobacterium kingsejongi]|uniref:Crp/Fnr family transcriptional regulator n=1 Tax=Flavobacterium kingsejongi TaxID=1678728 RepID=A0A2S1LPW4_9FLAO|nr:Crp/Fnr family transcriptional regulator [Flavobacterium kingsejongi]AWG25797.1 Crp/Fnr family transcriptional regulator [Flavobacterium kingsejongi]
MSKKALVAYFENTKLISLQTAAEIASHFQSKSIAKNELQLAEKGICDEYLFLEKGFMRAFAYDTEGNEVTTGFYSPGAVVFEVASFFNRTKSQENIQALTDCSGYYISYKQLNTLFHTVPQFREFGRSILVKGFSGLKTRMLSMITETAEERYLFLLKTNPEIFQHAPLKNIASYLGITDTSLSRIRKELSKKQ